MPERSRFCRRIPAIKAGVHATIVVMVCAASASAQNRSNPFITKSSALAKTAATKQPVDQPSTQAAPPSNILNQAIAAQDSATEPPLEQILKAADADFIEQAMMAQPEAVIDEQTTQTVSLADQMLSAADSDLLNRAIALQSSTTLPAQTPAHVQAPVIGQPWQKTLQPQQQPQPETVVKPVQALTNALPALQPPPTQFQNLPAVQSPRISMMQWWNRPASTQILGRPQWVTFDLETILVDTLRQSPRIRSLTHNAGMAMERIVQQDAAFDPTTLLSGTAGRTNDPVGNTLTTGGADRLREDSGNVRAGIQRSGRRGTQLGLNQELGLLDSNSTFFTPNDQGNARLSLSLNQPLLARGGQVYNERLLMQAQLDSRVTWQEMRSDVESRIGEVMIAYWRLYEDRCHLLQQRELLQRGERIRQVISARSGFDSGRVELAKARQRIARRQDLLVVLDADVKKQQTRLATLVGSPQLCGAEAQLELIPAQIPVFPNLQMNIHDVMVQAVENRPEIKAAASRLESAGLAVRVTRTEMVPQLNAIVNASLSALNGNNDFGQSFIDQFDGVTPGFSGGLQYEMPYGRRAAKARHREAQHQYRQRSEELREMIQQTQWETETALIDVNRALTQQQSKSKLLQTALDEEQILTRRWELIGGDGSRVGVVLENLLDAQQRRTDAEREFVTAQTDYMTSLVDLQIAMGTLLKHEGINSVRGGGSNINFVRTNHPNSLNAQAVSHPVVNNPPVVVHHQAVTAQANRVPNTNTQPQIPNPIRTQPERNVVATPISFPKR